MKTLSKTISFLAHPLLMPLYALAYIFLSNTPWTMLNDNVKLYSSIYTIVGLTVLPLTAYGIFVALHIVKRAQSPTPHERLLPIFAGVFCVGTTYVFSRIYPDIPMPEPILALIVGQFGILLVALLITSSWKISLHTAGIGALSAFIFFIGYLAQTDFFVEVILILIAIGVVASARLYLQEHSPAQLLGGYFLGIVVMFMALANCVMGL